MLTDSASTSRGLTSTETVTGQDTSNSAPTSKVENTGAEESIPNGRLSNGTHTFRTSGYDTFSTPSLTLTQKQPQNRMNQHTAVPKFGKRRSLADRPVWDPLPDIFVHLKDELPGIPNGCKVIKLVGEGAANAVFEIQLPSDAPDAVKQRFKGSRISNPSALASHVGIAELTRYQIGKLLRVQKEPRDYQNPPFLYGELFYFWKNVIQPAFKTHAQGRIPSDVLVGQELVVLEESDIVDTLNAHLSISDRSIQRQSQSQSQNSAEKPMSRSKSTPSLTKGLGLQEFTRRLSIRGESRNPKFLGQRVARVSFAMLVEDMQVSDPRDILFEFKPKWLAQSPSAPQGSGRCRTCAIAVKKHLQQQQQHQQPGRALPAPDTVVFNMCPLYLASTPSHRGTMANHLLGDNPSYTDAQRAKVRSWLECADAGAIFKTLRQLQLRYDTHGPLAGHPADERLALAMTLRDCTCFVTIRGGERGGVEVRLGDFDKKRVATKWMGWRDAEAGLRDQYLAGEQLGSACFIEEFGSDALTTMGMT
jgi:hypothetical protein